MEVHADLRAAKGHALGFQAQLLIQAGRAREENLAGRAQHAMPRQSPIGPLQGPCDLPGRAGKSGRFRDCAISSDLASRDFADGSAKFVEHNIFTLGVFA
jgi:hypothetical protein